MKIGDYVLASKYTDGDPRDQWCLGFYAGLTNAQKYNPPRYDVKNVNGEQYRGNGFRRVEKISRRRSAFILQNKSEIESGNKSIWYWKRCKIFNEKSMTADQKAILKRIEKYWEKHPDLRFGQMLGGIGVLEYVDLKLGYETVAVTQRDIFHDTDKQILERMKQ